MLYLIVFLLTFTLPVFASERADYILLSDPGDVVILNKYEQKTDFSFPPGIPFRIEEKDHLLSDGITSVYKCSFDKKEWFLLPVAGAPSIIKNCTVLNDSVRLIRSGIKIRGLDGQTELTAKELPLIRIFKKASKTYCFSKKFGWVRLSKNSWKTIKKETVKTAAFPAKLRARILSRMETVNDTYRTFFTFFNQKYHKSYAIPQWLYEEKTNALRLYLNQEEMAGKLKESFQSLKNDLQEIVLGSAYQCIREKEQFIILVHSGL